MGALYSLHTSELQQRMSDRGDKKVTPMDQDAKARIMSSEYKGNSGRATDWSSRAQSAADKNYPQQQQQQKIVGATRK